MGFPHVSSKAKVRDEKGGVAMLWGECGIQRCQACDQQGKQVSQEEHLGAYQRSGGEISLLYSM